jgi:hypothetical protein
MSTPPSPSPSNVRHLKVRMTCAKSTKHKHVYKSPDPGTPVPSVYVLKSALPTPAPKTILVTISFPDQT